MPYARLLMLVTSSLPILGKPAECTTQSAVSDTLRFVTLCCTQVTLGYYYSIGGRTERRASSARKSHEEDPRCQAKAFPTSLWQLQRRVTARAVKQRVFELVNILSLAVIAVYVDADRTVL